MRHILRAVFLPFIAVFEAMMPASMMGSKTQIVPQASVSGRALTAVIAIMSFLACLTAGAVYMVNQSANAWFRDIASEVTVQITPIASHPMTDRINDVTLFLSRQKGVVKIRPLSLKDSNELLEPWLGKSSAFEALPMPRLIAVEVDRDNPPDMKALGSRLSRQFEKVILDDHRHWQAQIRTVTRSVALGGIVLLFLVAVATISIVLSAARAAMAANKDIVEVLHFVGAKKSFITNEFQRHFLRTGIRSGVMGALAATLAFWTMPVLMRFMGGQSITAAELKRFIGNATLDTQGHLTLVAVVVGVSAICMYTSRYWVNRILNTSEAQTTGYVSGKKRGRSWSVASRFKKRTTKFSPGSNRGEDSRMKVVFRFARGLVFVAMALLIIGFGVFMASIEKSRKLPANSADGIVVLTGGKARVSEAVKLLAAGKGRRLLISGVNSKTNQNELIRFTPASEPLFDCCIDLGKEAQNTLGNAEEIARWTHQRNFKSLIFVTSNYHMPRSLAETKRLLPEIKFMPYAVIPDRFKDGTWWYDPSTLMLLGREYLKMFRTRLRGWLSPISQRRG